MIELIDELIDCMGEADYHSRLSRAFATTIRIALAAAESLPVPTPEYVSGWLARGRADEDAVLAPWDSLGDRPSSPPAALYGACDRIRALAPPSAPPVQQIEDRMLLLKALVRGEAIWSDSGIYSASPGITVGGHRYAMTYDTESLPLLTDDLRAALIKATEANHD